MYFNLICHHILLTTQVNDEMIQCVLCEDWFHDNVRFKSVKILRKTKLHDPTRGCDPIQHLTAMFVGSTLAVHWRNQRSWRRWYVKPA